MNANQNQREYESNSNENLNFDFDELEAQLEGELEQQLADLESLKLDRDAIGDPDKLGKVVLDEVWKQFGIQLGLDLTNETLIQKYEREHPESYDEVKDQVLKDPAYKKAVNDMKEKQKTGELEDSYSNNNIGPNDKANLDHTVSRKEIYEDKRRRQAGLSTEDIANIDENLNPTSEALNKSKGAKSVDEYWENYEQRVEDLKKQNEKAKQKIDNDPNISDVEKKLAKEKLDKNLNDKLAADEQKMKAADKKARAAIKKAEAKGIAKQTAKKAGIDALKVMAVSALSTLLKEIVNALIRFFKEKSKSFKSFIDEMREAFRRFVNKISNIVHSGATSVVGTVVTEIFGPVVSMFKKLASLIKQGINSFLEAIRYLTDKKNKNKPFSVKVAQCGKIITAGLAAVGGILLSEVVEKALMTIPVFNVQIPLLGSLANITGLFLGAVISGVIGAIIINLIDKFIAKRERQANTTAQIEKKNEILAVQEHLLAVTNAKVEATKMRAAQNITERHNLAAQEIRQAAEQIFRDKPTNNNDKILEECWKMLNSDKKY